MNGKQTKRALLGSLTSLLLCFAMLIGSTFAWFTDTASTSVNTIQAGTLDVALKMATAWDANGGVATWADAEGETLNFIKATGHESESVLWEPGATYKLPEIKIVNEGNLALKFKVDVIGATGDSALADVLDVKTSYVPVNSEGTKGTAVTSPVTTLAQVLTVDPDGIAYGKLAAGESIEVSISMQMQTSADNTYQGMKINGIAVTVVATQDTVESDSNNNQYDKDAKFPTVAALPTDEADTVGGNLSLSTNVIGSAGNTSQTLTNTNVAYRLTGENAIFNGNGNTITLPGAGVGIEVPNGTIKDVTIKNAGRGIMTYNTTGDITIDNVKILNSGYAINTGSGTTNAAKLIVKNSTLNGWSSWDNVSSASFTNCSFGESTYFEGSTSYEFYKHFLRPYVTTTFTNCDFTEGYYLDLSRMLDNNGTATGTVTLENCSINGVKLTKDNFASYMKILIDKQDTEATSTTLPSFVTFK